jgi:phosphonate transport system permease protein
MSARGRSSGDAERLGEVGALWRARPRSWLLRATAVVFSLGVAAAWLSGELEVTRFLEPRRLDNLQRFLTQDALPVPLRGDAGTLADLWRWVVGILADRGLEALLATLALAVAAAVLAGALALVLAPLCARTLAARHPYADPAFVGGERARRGPGWRLLAGAARSLAVLLRALPEYVLAFLFGAVLPSVAWAAVLALAVHNGGILARLYGETLENVPPKPFRALVELGAGRRQLAALALLPVALPRFLLYFFYRFETCVREATVLGMLGFVSLGYWIQDARARMQYDTMLLLVGLGVVIVLVGDLCSYVARAVVRRAA